MDLEKLEVASAKADIVECLLESELIEGNAAGVARQWLAGERSLSDKQQFVFEKEIGLYFKMDCRRCDLPLSLPEIAIAMHEDDRLCGWCRHMEEKMAED